MKLSFRKNLIRIDLETMCRVCTIIIAILVELRAAPVYAPCPGSIHSACAHATVKLNKHLLLVLVYTLNKITIKSRLLPALIARSPSCIRGK